MNRYAQIARNRHLELRPTEHALIENPDQFFEEVGEELQEKITSRRDQILGQPKPGETPEAYRRRSYQALATARELTLAEHHLFRSETSASSQEVEYDSVLSRYLHDLDQVNRAIHEHPEP